MLIRPMKVDDLPALFRNMQDPVAACMAAFMGNDAGDLEKYLAKWTRLLGDPNIHSFTCVEDDPEVGAVVGAVGVVVGMVSSFVMEGEREVTYWISREYWGRGLATAAMRHLLAHVAERPIYARAASDNAGSIRVLLKCGFQPIGTERAFANARGEEIEETIFRLDAPRRSDS